MTSALELIDDLIAELEGRLNLKPGQDVSVVKERVDQDRSLEPAKQPKSKKPATTPPKSTQQQPPLAADLPEICKLEFKVGQIVKVWPHEAADKLYCEEIDVGESEPRQIASGLRLVFTLEQMMGQRVLVVSNLKAKNLVGFKSHGMVLCAKSAADENGTDECVIEFVEPPADATIGEVVTYEGLPPPQPLSASQVEKKKVFQNCLPGLQTTEDCMAAWNGHVFTTSAGPCKTKTIANGPMS